MRFLHLVPTGSTSPTLGVELGGGAIAVSSILDEAPPLLQDLIERGPTEWARVRAAIEAAVPSTRELIPLDTLVRAPAVLRPPAILAVGLNYAEHAEELGLDIHADPTVFPLLPNSLGADGGTVDIPRSLVTAFDYECELGVVIGRAARDVSEDDALDFVFGYTVVNDMTARDIQFREQQWSRCKSFDGFTPVGPVVVTADEIPHPQALRLLTTVNGDVVQDASTSHMIRSVAELVSYLSSGSTLLPGTLISTGTPSGAGFSRSPQVLLRGGDVVVVSIEGIGAVTTTCREA